MFFSFYKNDEQRLYSHLMRRYVKYGRPVYDSKDRLTVSTTSFLKNFANFDPETKEMTIVFLSINVSMRTFKSTITFFYF